MKIELTPIAFVQNSRKTIIDDHWSGIISEIVLEKHIPKESFENIHLFSHLEIIYFFDRVDPSKIVYSGHPRENTNYLSMGIFAQRKKDRPNHIGLCTVEIIEVLEKKLIVKNLDAIDGTPILDIKPVFKEFLPKGDVKQPDWVEDLMKEYWH
jgi:tRNA (adenine37-N6)-methyltransferase